MATQRQIANLQALLIFAGEAVIDDALPQGMTAPDFVARYKEIEALPATEAHHAKLLEQARFLHDKYAVDHGADLDGVTTVGQAYTLSQRMEAEYQQRSAPAPASAPPAAPAGPPATKQQLERLQKLQAALGRPAVVQPGLTQEAAASQIAELVRVFNSQSRQGASR